MTDQWPLDPEDVARARHQDKEREEAGRRLYERTASRIATSKGVLDPLPWEELPHAAQRQWIARAWKE